MSLRIHIAGGGPAGLFCAYLVRRDHPGHEVVVWERNPPDATYGFGVVFQDQALGYLADADERAFRRITAGLESWDHLAIYQNGERVLIDGNGFTAIARLHLLDILHRLCRDVGVELRFETEVDGAAMLAGADLVVGADGVGSAVRESLAGHFRPTVRYLDNRFAWFGTRRAFDTLSLTFRRSGDECYVAHHYRYQADASTFIVECDALTFERARLGDLDEGRSAAYCARIFTDDLEGEPLLCNRSLWRRFPVIENERWHHGKVVLIGDALRTVHFSIGSGTRLALEDAIALAAALSESGDDVTAALATFEARRRPVVDKMLAAAAASYHWYERFRERMDLDAWQLAYDYMTRSGRVDDERLARISPAFMAGYRRRHPPAD